MRAAVDADPAASRFVIGPGEPPAVALTGSDAVMAVGRPVGDTCKEVREGLVQRTVPRETLVELAGPWLVTRVALTGALARADAGPPASDLLELFRRAGIPIRVVTAQ